MRKRCWEKLGLLGKGSYGAVYLAAPLCRSTTTSAAVKSADAACSSSLRMEGVILDVLKGSPYILRCFGEDESFENGKQTYNLLLEYAAGGTLHDLIGRKRGQMTEPEVAFYAFQLLKGISHVHSKGLIHCDLKPCNVLVFPDNNVLKLADFGLALEAGNETENHKYFRGTLLYASPEAVARGVYGKAVDIWALGCIVVEMFTGRPLWSERYATRELELNITYQEAEIPRGVSKAARDFMAKCLVRDHKRRWTADMLLDHPFIQSYRYPNHEDGLNMSTNPFGHGRSSWVSSKNLFSTLASSCNPDYSTRGCNIIPKNVQQVPAM